MATSDASLSDATSTAIRAKSTGCKLVFIATGWHYICATTAGQLE